MNPTEYVDMPILVSEFGAAVHWGGPYGTINAAAGHHISEGRWIRDPMPMDSNIKFWVSPNIQKNLQVFSDSPIPFVLSFLSLSLSLACNGCFHF